MDGVLPIESELGLLVEEGHSRTRATELVIERAVTEASGASCVVLVEGVSDRIALEVIAEGQGRLLRDEGISIVPMGGATNIGRFLTLFDGVRLAGLYDVAEEGHFARRLERAGFGRDLDLQQMEPLGFFACDVDLEDELIRALGPDEVERIIASQGDLSSFRTMQREPFHRTREHRQQLYRFVRGRNYRYARPLAEALDPARIPPPHERLLAYL
jgi:OLD-like protein